MITFKHVLHDADYLGFVHLNRENGIHAIYSTILTSRDAFTMNFAKRSERLQLVPGYAMVIRRC